MSESSAEISDEVQYAMQLHAAGEYQQALGRYQKILQVAPANAPLLRLIGLAYSSLGDYEAAIQYLERSLKADFVAHVCYELGQLYGAVGRLPQYIDTFLPQLVAFSTAQECCELGNRLCQSGCYQGAETVLRRAVERLPSVPLVHQCYAKALFHTGQYAEAKEEYLRHLQLKGIPSAGKEILVGRLMHMRGYCSEQRTTRYVRLKEERVCVMRKLLPFGSDVGALSEPPVFGIEPEFYIAEVDNASIVGGLNFIVGKDDAIIYDLAVHPLVERYDLAMSDPCVKFYNGSKMLLDIPSFACTEAVIDCGIMISGLASHWWSHWLLEYAPHFWSIDQFSEYDHLPLLVDERVFQDAHVTETLKILNSRGRLVIPLKEHKRYFCKRLIVPSRLVHLPHDLKLGLNIDYNDQFISETAVKFLRSKLYQEQDCAPAERKRIYMSRRDAPLPAPDQ